MWRSLSPKPPRWIGTCDESRTASRGSAEEFLPETDETDAVTFHLWLAVQLAIDLATSVCVRLGLGAPSTYADAFRRLAESGTIKPELAERLKRATDFRNVIVGLENDTAWQFRRRAS